MSRWFRLYDELLDDPKVQRLSGDDFKAWVNLLCLASRNGGSLPSETDVAFALRLDAKKSAAVLSRLVEVGLLDRSDIGLAPHGWNERQYKSDVSTGRVKQFRERKKGVSGNSDETFHATPPETDTETDTPLAKANGAVSDPSKTLFDLGVDALSSQGVSVATARSFLAKCQADHTDAVALDALNKSIGATDIRSRMRAILGKRANQFEYAGGPC